MLDPGGTIIVVICDLSNVSQGSSGPNGLEAQGQVRRMIVLECSGSGGRGGAGIQPARRTVSSKPSVDGVFEATPAAVIRDWLTHWEVDVVTDNDGVLRAAVFFRSRTTADDVARQSTEGALPNLGFVTEEDVGVDD